MPCYHPMPAVRLGDGSVSFVSRNKRGVVGDLELPCGQCIGCRLERSRQWAMRCMHEASLHENNAFVTLTYDDEHIPAGGTLRYEDFQLFMKRLRKWFTPLRISFYCGGEYGETTSRPHYHACLFGVRFPDQKYFSRTGSGEKIYTSEILQRLWPLGMSSIGNVTFESAAYIARYCVAKVTGDLAEAHYRVVTADGEIVDRVPEFNHMSLKPAVGKRWLDKYMMQTYPRDYVIVNGVKVKPPKYYDRLFESFDPGAWSEVVAAREFKALPRRADNSVARLAVKEQVQKAAITFLKRDLS